MPKPRRLLPLLLGLAAIGCGSGGGGGGGPRAVTLSWAANHEAAVNAAGGGYVLYYSETPDFDPALSGVASVTVPYASGPLAPTTATLTLPAGTYYFRTAAYSALGSGALSAASEALRVVVP